jgi:hypothetical protein
VNRYVVVDTWEEDGTVTCGCAGQVLDSFFSLDSAQALALQRMAYGSVGVVVVDQVNGEKVFPLPDVEDNEEDPDSGVRLRRAGAAAWGATRTKDARSRDVPAREAGENDTQNRAEHSASLASVCRERESWDSIAEDCSASGSSSTR